MDSGYYDKQDRLPVQKKIESGGFCFQMIVRMEEWGKRETADKSAWEDAAGTISKSANSHSLCMEGGKYWLKS